MAGAKRKKRTRKGEPAWASLDDEGLLDLKLSQLGIGVQGSLVEERVQQLHAELGRAGMRFRPYVWLSDDWFTPDGLPGFAVPFYLAHRRLVRLEKRHMLEVEGGTNEWCMRLMRHEAGHAICNAYRLHRRRRWREMFGRFSDPYRQTYVPRPYSKSYVVNLDNWYAQSHPCEDFAETFAVWLKPRSRWWVRYEGWPALKKLEYVDELMYEIYDQPMVTRSRERPGSLAKMRKTLREHWAEKQARYDDGHDPTYDRDLRRLFSDDPAYSRRLRADAFLRRYRRSLRERVSRNTGQYRYLVDQVLDEMIARCAEQGLRLCRSERESRLDAAVLLTVRIMSHLHAGYHHYSR